jgi:chemotaxis protein MotB
MKKLRYLAPIMALLLIGSSCAPVYKCGDPVPDKKPKGKRVKAVVAERDSLCNTLSLSQSENANLKSQISRLNDKQNDLTNQNLSQEELYNKILGEKSQELNQKEKLLLERERALREMRQIIARQDSITKRLNDVLRNALLGFNSDELSLEVKNGKVYVSMSDKLLFKSGSAAVESKGQEAIKLLADVLAKNPDIDILIEGHTDNVPIKTAIYKDNWDLSVARAASIVRMLTDQHKIPATRVTASGRGEFVPRESNATPEGRAKNRRTEIILSPKLDEIMQLLNNK